MCRPSAPQAYDPVANRDCAGVAGPDAEPAGENPAAVAFPDQVHMGDPMVQHLSTPEVLRKEDLGA